MSMVERLKLKNEVVDVSAVLISNKRPKIEHWSKLRTQINRSKLISDTWTISGLQKRKYKRRMRNQNNSML